MAAAAFFEFIIVAYFGHMVYFQWWLATVLQNCINLPQLIAELLLSVQKFKISAAAILDLIYVQYYYQFVRRAIK